MNIFVKRENGAITIFIALMLVSILSIGSLVLEAGRLQSARTQLNEATVSAETSIISSYDLTLNDRFGILAFEDGEETKAAFNDYLSFNSDLDGNYKGNNVTRLYSIFNVDMDGVYNFTYPEVMKRQVLSTSRYLKSTYNFPINIDTLSTFWADFNTKAQKAMNIINSATSQNGSISGAHFSALKAVEKAFTNIYDYDKNCIVVLPGDEASKLPSKTGTVQDSIPADEVSKIQKTLDRAKSVVGEHASSIGNVDKGADITETSVGVTANLTSTRAEMQKLVSGGRYNLGNIRTLCNNSIGKMIDVAKALSKNDTAETNMIINSYISSCFSNRAALANGSVKDRKSVV